MVQSKEFQIRDNLQVLIAFFIILNFITEIYISRVIFNLRARFEMEKYLYFNTVLKILSLRRKAFTLLPDY